MVAGKATRQAKRRCRRIAGWPKGSICPIMRRVAPSLGGSAIGSTGDDNGARRVLPNALDAAKPGGTQRGQMPVHAVDKAIAVQEMATGSEETMDRGIACKDLFLASEIVEDDRRDRQIERSSDMLRPPRVQQIGKDIREPVGVAGKTSARPIEHRPGIVLQSNVCFGERVQDLLGDDTVSGADV